MVELARFMRFRIRPLHALLILTPSKFSKLCYICSSPGCLYFRVSTLYLLCFICAFSAIFLLSTLTMHFIGFACVFSNYFMASVACKCLCVYMLHALRCCGNLCIVLVFGSFTIATRHIFITHCHMLVYWKEAPTNYLRQPHNRPQQAASCSSPHFLTIARYFSCPAAHFSPHSLCRFITSIFLIFYIFIAHFFFFFLLIFVFVNLPLCLC